MRGVGVVRTRITRPTQAMWEAYKKLGIAVWSIWSIDAYHFTQTDSYVETYFAIF
jgi:hypothetical protein